MKSALQLDPSVDVLGNRLPNVFIQHTKVGESLFTGQIERLAARLDPASVPLPQILFGLRGGLPSGHHSGTCRPGSAKAPSRSQPGHARGLLR